MTEQDDWREILESADAKACPQCQSQAFIVTPEDEADRDERLPLAANARAGFCFECGYREPSGDAQ